MTIWMEQQYGSYKNQVSKATVHAQFNGFMFCQSVGIHPILE